MTDREIVEKIAKGEHGCFGFEVGCKTCRLNSICKDARDSKDTAHQWLKDNPKEQGKPTQEQIDADIAYAEQNWIGEAKGNNARVLRLASALREAQAEVSRIQNFFDAEVQLRREWQVRAEKAEAEVSRLRGIMEYLHHGEFGPIPEGFLDDARDCYEHAIDLAGGEEPTDDQWYQGWIEMIENAMVRSALKLREVK